MVILHPSPSSSPSLQNHALCISAPCFRPSTLPPSLLRPSLLGGLHLRYASISPLCKQQQVPPSSAPSSRDEAIEQARHSIALVLDKALRTSGPSPVRQRKLYKQSRLRVELPLLDETDSARASLLHDLLSPMSIGKRGAMPSSCVFCNAGLIEKLVTTRSHNFDSRASADATATGSPRMQYCDIAKMVDLQDVQLVIILAPKLSEVAYMEEIVKSAGTKPVLLMNPDWSPEEEEEASKAPFLQTFEVIYSYLPLVIQGFFSKTEGAVVKHVKGGAPTGRPWLIYVKDGDKMNCVSSLKNRPTAVDLENALYNAMAANSPVTRSVKYLRGLVRKS